MVAAASSGQPMAASCGPNTQLQKERWNGMEGRSGCVSLPLPRRSSFVALRGEAGGQGARRGQFKSCEIRVPPPASAPWTASPTPTRRRKRGEWSESSIVRLLETYEAKWLLHAEPRRAHSTGANESKIAREVSVHCTDDAAAAWNGSPPGPGGGNRAKRRSPPRWRARGPPLPPRRGGSFCPDCSKGRPSALAKRRHTLLVLGKGVRWQVWSSCRWTKPRFPTATVPKIRRFQFPTPCPKPHVLELRMRRAWGSTPPPQSCSLFPPNSTTTNLLAVLLSRHHRPRRPLPAVP